MERKDKLCNRYRHTIGDSSSARWRPAPRWCWGITAFGAALPAAAATSDRTVGSDEFAAPLYRVLKNDTTWTGTAA